jgi:hypothetical protein
MALGGVARRRWRCRLTVAGSRYAHAPATRARRAWVFPALVMEPCRRRAPLEYSAGIGPGTASAVWGERRGSGRPVRPPWSPPR